MNMVFLLTAFLFLVYMAYPLWLKVISSDKTEKEPETENIDSVSLVLLSFNGISYLEEKVDFLRRELSFFQNHELIIVDDQSTDGSRELLEKFRETENIKLLLKSRQKGIADSMNIAVENAKYEYIIFCDQRQKLSGNILQKVIEPLKNRETGAVSGCICHLDKQNSFSFLRKYENFIKAQESKAGSLIGVYGPFYAIKKQCYSIIPEDTILDDLYLSLRILKTKQIELREDCRIIDDNFAHLNNYKRARRYVSGFLQILKDKTLIRDLSTRQKTMLFWHKYIRLFIPLLLFLCYVSSGMMIMQGTGYQILFCVLTFAGLFSFVPLRIKFQFRLKNLIRINLLYTIALADILVNDILLRRGAVSGALGDSIPGDGVPN
jgi:biofilm PGA synthesis N-glycosyltransferase PgaC